MLLAPSNDTWKVRSVPSSPMASSVEMIGSASVSTMVPVASSRASVAFCGADSVSVKVSSCSWMSSSSASSAMVRRVSPRAKVSDPLPGS